MGVYQQGVTSGTDMAVASGTRWKGFVETGTEIQQYVIHSTCSENMSAIREKEFLTHNRLFLPQFYVILVYLALKFLSYFLIAKFY
jgi:hypothetical protein